VIPFAQYSRMLTRPVASSPISRPSTEPRSCQGPISTPFSKTGWTACFPRNLSPKNTVGWA